MIGNKAQSPAGGSKPAHLSVGVDGLYYHVLDKDLQPDERVIYKIDAQDQWWVVDRISSREVYKPWYVLGRNLIYFKDDGVHGSELWVYDGSQSFMLIDAIEGSESLDRYHIRVFENELYVAASLITSSGDDVGIKIIRSDGTLMGTEVIHSYSTADVIRKEALSSERQWTHRVHTMSFSDDMKALFISAETLMVLELNDPPVKNYQMSLWSIRI